MVDFDGTLCEWGYPGMGSPTEGARGAMQVLQDMGFHVVIYTARMDSSIYTREEREDTLKVMRAWFEINKIPYDAIDNGSSGKPVAACYIDDKGVNFRGDWGEVLTNVRVLKELEGERHGTEVRSVDDWNRSRLQRDRALSTESTWNRLDSNDAEGRAGE